MENESEGALDWRWIYKISLRGWGISKKPAWHNCKKEISEAFEA